MQDKYIKKFEELDINSKREILLKDICEVLTVIETLCIKNKIKINKLKSSYYIKNRKLLLDEDYFNLMFIYITYLKEDLALLLEKNA